MTDVQKAALKALSTALVNATESGLFDAMEHNVHPYIINDFCDAVQQEENLEGVA